MLTYLMGIKAEPRGTTLSSKLEIDCRCNLQIKTLMHIDTCTLRWSICKKHMHAVFAVDVHMYVCVPAKCLSESGTFHSLITDNELKLPENGYEDNSLYNIQLPSDNAQECVLPDTNLSTYRTYKTIHTNKNIKNTHTQELMSLCVCRQGSPEREPTEITRGRREEENCLTEKSTKQTLQEKVLHLSSTLL